jgi:osmoprotectant transport system permease protein
MKSTWLVLVVLVGVPALTLGAEPQPVRLRVGVKDFPESAILGEMVARLARHAGVNCTVDPPGKGSQLWNALQRGNIHAYVDYTGTLQLFLPGVEDIETELNKLGIQMIPLGFQNDYALGMLEQVAQEKNIRRISDLAREEHKDLTFGFDEEFLHRRDGWDQLQEKYRLPQSVKLVEHEQAYQALHGGEIHGMDCYTTDGQLSQDRPKIRLLEDDRNYFPSYKAVLLLRGEIPENVRREWSKLEGRISQSDMQRMNAAVSPKKQEHEVAAAFLKERLKVPIRAEEPEDAPGPSARERQEVHITIGAKGFTESVILAEMASHLVRHTGARASITNLGGSEVVWEALKNGDIDLYIEYTGTLQQQLLPGVRDLEPILAQYDIRMSQPLGFKNNYALGMLQTRAEERHITKVSDLQAEENRNLKFGCSHEFLNRKDGWPGLQRKYSLTQKPKGLQHDLAYAALARENIDVMDVFTTDGDVDYYQMKVLEDDRGFFAVYDAVLLYRPDRVPPWVRKEVLGKMEGQISEQEMRQMNYRAKQKRISETRVAADFLNEKFALGIEVKEPGILGNILYRTWQHSLLVLVSLVLAVVLGVPLGILAARWVASRPVILSAVGIMQTLPSLAVLALLVAVGLGIGTLPAIIAMFLYCLLPIVMGTYTGLVSVPTSMRETVASMGLPPRASLLLVELPLASRSILTGVKTSAIICVALGTLGAFIGAGGYGVDILAGVRLSNTARILQGAIPAVMMSLAVMGLFEVAERVVLPRGLRIQAA